MTPKINAQNIFLIDGIGAITTASLLYFLLGTFTDFFGVSHETLYVLSGIALCFAIYSFCCHMLLKTKLRPYLSLLSVLNISYCVMTTIMIFRSTTITTWSITYFIGEMLLVLALAILELKLARSHRN